MYIAMKHLGLVRFYFIFQLWTFIQQKHIIWIKNDRKDDYNITHISNK